jgi:thiamine-monophosphate kinase
VGDDLAILKWPSDELLLVGVDQVIDGVHFDSTKHSPGQIGRKVVNRNFSDCAAMGCLPAAVIAAVALPRGYSLEKAKELYAGLREAADAMECPIVGGDTAVWDGKLIATVTVLGRTGGVRPVGRAGARVGDLIYVTGALGGSILGRHLDFSPRVAMGFQIAPLAHAMIDISDGLSRDLGHICRASGVGALLEAEKIPIHPDADELSKRDGKSPLAHALHDGEDYELVYTSSSESAPGHCIGRIVTKEGIWMEDKNRQRHLVEEKGFEHDWG